MKSFIIIGLLTVCCFTIAGISSKNLDEKKLEATLNKSIFKDQKTQAKEKFFPIDQISKLKLESLHQDIQFFASSDLTDQIKMEYNEIFDAKTDELLYPNFETERTPQKLSILFKKSRYQKDTWKNNISVNLNFPHFNISTSEVNRKLVKIYFPAKSSLSELFLETKSGDVDFEDVSLSKINLEVYSGDLSFTNVQNKELSIRSKSGDVEFENASLENVKVISTSGDIEFEDTRVSSLIEIKSTSGDIEFEGKVEKANLKSTSGDIHIQTKGKEPQMEISATAGDIDLHFLNTPDANMDISSIAGDITVDGTGYKRHKNPLVFGKGKGVVKVDTTAGDISITTKD